MGPTVPARVAAPRYACLGWAIVRAPLLPVETYNALQVADGGGYATQPGSLMPADDLVRLALAVGAGDLARALSVTPPDARKAAKVRGKLLRYLIRMSTRPTPYGMFAGVALSEFGEETDLRLADKPPRVRARPDMAWLLGLVGTLESRPEVRAQLTLSANPSGIVHNGRLSLTEPAALGEGSGQATVSLRATAPVRRALELANLPISYPRLAAALGKACDASPQLIDRLLATLIGHGVLFTDLRPPLTRPDPAGHVARRLAGVAPATQTRAALCEILDGWRRWDELPAADAVTELPRLAGRTAALCSIDAPAEAAQVDMALRLEGRRINHAVSETVAEAAALLLAITPAPHGMRHLDAYRRSFEARYGPNAEVPLVELLDPAVGLGPPPEHVHGIADDAERVAVRQRTLRALALDALRDHRLEVDLDDATLPDLAVGGSDQVFPRSLDLSVFVLAESPAAVDAGAFDIVIGPNLGAQAAGRNLGRFGDLLGPEADLALTEIARAESAMTPNAVWAEVTYLPHNRRSANVTVRPCVRDYEIPVNTTPGVSADRVIPLNELAVVVREAHLRLWWPRGGFEVIPCAGHMLNSWQAPPVCRFLEDLSRDGVAQFNNFDWGAGADLPVLPRVRYGRVVLTPAQWRLARAGGRTGCGELPAKDPKAFDAAVSRWRQRWQVPQLVYLSAGDNRLLLDLDQPEQREQLRQELLGLMAGRQLILEEPLPAPEHAWVPGPNGRYVTEFVVPLVLADEISAAKPPLVATLPNRRPAPHRLVTDRDRLRPPGSDWLYAKLYCPPERQDELICDPVRSFADYCRSVDYAEEFFFIRYTDPEHHLRVRWRGSAERMIGDLLPELCAWAGVLIDDGTLTRWCLDTYEREVERYGGVQAMPLAETLFAADSAAVAALIAAQTAGQLGLDRTALAVLSTDDLLAGLGLDPDERLRWVGGQVSDRRSSGPEYRQRQAVLRPLLGSPAFLAAQRGGDHVAAVLAARRTALAPIRSGLRELAADGLLGHDLAFLCRSYVHMHCNRMFASGAPAVENTVLGLLARTRESLHRAAVAR